VSTVGVTSAHAWSIAARLLAPRQAILGEDVVMMNTITYRARGTSS
jgi:hypothetical protein